MERNENGFSAFGISTDELLQDKKLTILLKGEIDHHMARETMKLIGEKIDGYLPTLCILDYKSVSFMDSSGIAVVLFTLRKMRELEGELRLQNLPTSVEKVIRAAGVQNLIKIAERTECHECQ